MTERNGTWPPEMSCNNCGHEKRHHGEYGCQYGSSARPRRSGCPCWEYVSEVSDTKDVGEANRQTLIDRSRQYGVGSGPLKVVMTEREIVALVEALRGFLEEDGGCDHSVGICACGVIWFITAIDHLQGKHEARPDPYDCGSCGTVAEEWEREGAIPNIDE